jgi:protein-S-isoprenylcysteine O-methyltransferase Ste14
MNRIAGNSFQSWMLVMIQFICLFILIYSGHFITRKPSVFLAIFAIVLGIWAVLAMKPGTINVFPEVRDGASFVSNGPYRLVRHPMYLSLILFSFSLLLNYFNILRLITFLVLVICLIYKIEFEEKILISKFPGYKHYQLKSKKLIPFIY